MTGSNTGRERLAGPPAGPDAAGGRRAPDRDPPEESQRSLLPGLAVAAVAVAVSLGLNAMVPTVSPLIVALLLGAVLGNTAIPASGLEPGLRFASRRLLRVGIVLLGVQLAVPDVLRLGLPVLGLILGTVAITFLGTRWLGLRLGLGPDRALLVATGVSICGAAAVTAMDGVTDSESEDVANAVAVVTLYGSVMMLVLPLLHAPLGLTGAAFGVWVGGSVHEVAQVVAAAGTVGTAALGTAVVVKLTRVVLLAPLIATVALVRRRGAPGAGPSRPPLLPLFVAGFLAMMALRSVGVVPDVLLGPLTTLQTVLFTAALFGMGAGVRVVTLVRTGAASMLVGALASVLIGAVALVGVLLVG